MTMASERTAEVVRFRRPHLRTFDPKAALAKVQQYRSLPPLDKANNVDEATKKRRIRLWKNWLCFAESMNIGTEEPWIDLCIGNNDCVPLFQAFLKIYVEDSVAERVCLGPEEYEFVRTVDSGTSIEAAWGFLVREADQIVMLPKRMADRQNAGSWTVKYHCGRVARGCGLAYEIGRWIPDLCDELGLIKEQGFEKTSTTSSDLIRLFDTVWARAVDIPCTPRKRLYWHAAGIIAGNTGTRPSSFVKVRYKDVVFAWIRDPNIPTRIWPVVTVTIFHVKQERNKIKRNQRDKFRFASTPVPFKLLCLLTILTTVAVADNAFEAGFASCDEFLHPPSMEDGTDYVQLRWKPEFEDKCIVDIPYKEFLRVWHRVNTVVGSRERYRPYALRVGSAGRLDGCLAPALRNFILSQSTEVFEDSYQPIQMRDHLAHLTYGKLAQHDEALWSAISDSYLKIDPGAPIYLTTKELEAIGRRRDITGLRQEITTLRQKLGANSKEEKQIWGKIQYITDCCEELMLEKKRQEYFAEVDLLRAMQKSTAHLQQRGAKNPRKKNFADSSAVAAKLGPMLVAEQPAEGLADKIVAYLHGRKFTETSVTSSKTKARVREPPRCLFGCGTFASTTTLTRHVRKMHMEIFTKPFRCPECSRRGDGDHLIQANPGSWSNHVERIHGKMHAPNFELCEDALCLLCRRTFKRRGFTNHLLLGHKTCFEQPFTCPKCDDVKSIIVGQDSWVAHVRDVHGGTEVTGAILVEDGPSGEVDSKSSLAVENVTPPLARKRPLETPTYGAGQKRVVRFDQDGHETVPARSVIPEPKISANLLEDVEGNACDWQPKASESPSDEYYNESESWDDVACRGSDCAGHGYYQSGHEDEEFYVDGRD